jgi:S-adenosylmethionine hydrolase
MGTPTYCYKNKPVFPIEEGAMSIITLLTDFGLQDPFVGSMKGVMLGVNPDLTLVDISHLVPPQDIFTGAFILGQSCFCFPPNSVHLAVVDPGVGTPRRALAASAGGHYFVAPDNGILTYVLAGQDFQAFEITSDHYFRKPVSSTFHGRDIFAPIAAWISRGIPLHQLGTFLEEPVRLKLPVPTRVKENLIQGCILAVDHFGNLITNLMPRDLPQSFKILAGQKEITNHRETYGEGTPGEIFVVPGSTGHLEIVVRDGSAASALNLKSRSPIGVVLLEKGEE